MWQGWYVLSYVGCILGSLVATRIETICSWKRTVKMEMSIKRDFFRKVTGYRFQQFIKRDIGEYLSMQSNELSQLELDYFGRIIDIGKHIASLVAYSFVMFVYVDWQIGLLIASTSLVIAVVAPRIGTGKLSLMRKEYLDEVGSYTSRTKDLLEGFKLLHADTRDRLRAVHDESMEKIGQKRYVYGRFRSLLDVMRGGFYYLINIVSYLSVGLFILAGRTSVGSGVAALGYIDSFMTPVQWIIIDFTALKSVEAVKKKIMEILDSEDVPYTEAQAVKSFQSAIVLKHYGVKYDRFSLTDFSFTFEKGKKYALIGGNGSGKSIILNSIANFIDPEVTSGEIYIDQRVLQDCDLSAVLWMVDQYEHVFRDDFKNNTTVYGSFPLPPDGVGGSLWRVHSGTKKLEMVWNGSVSSFLRAEDYLYIQEAMSGIYRTKLDGSDPQLIYKGLTNAAVLRKEGEWLFFSVLNDGELENNPESSRYVRYHMKTEEIEEVL